MSYNSTDNSIFYSDLEGKLSELITTHQRFQELTDQTETMDSLMNYIINKFEKTRHIYATYTKIIGYLESACAAAGIDAGQTLFRVCGFDLVNVKANRKFSLGVFIIKFPDYYLAIPVKMPAGANYYGNDNTVYIYKPFLVQSRFDGRKVVDIPVMEGFTCLYGKEPARLMTIYISTDQEEELSKAQIKKIKTALTTAMISAEKTMAAVETQQAQVATTTN